MSTQLSELLSRLDPEVVKQFEEKGVRYVRYLPNKSRGEYLNWQHVFRTTQRQDVEQRVEEQGYNITLDPTGDLYLWQNRPAFIQHPLTGKKIWFTRHTNTTPHITRHCQRLPASISRMKKFPTHTYYGDGSVIPPETIQHLRATSWACAVGFQWRSSDLLVADNLAAQHGRMSFTGERMNLVYLTE
ncbi:hypothetical protein OS493_027998 [Desmophyllum pertusum]|uniref:TauD/TfdA-like domain-containing protein n=1 Tax=Desmophyllum pertusum TaxID=174260 RepID=A0A9X0CD16_9CNID|nr:hypothetical protein OS493_027998 [Desmophyllum pertusum]